MKFKNRKYYAKTQIKKGTELTLDYTIGNYIIGDLDFKNNSCKKKSNNKLLIVCNTSFTSAFCIIVLCQILLRND